MHETLNRILGSTSGRECKKNLSGDPENWDVVNVIADKLPVLYRGIDSTAARECSAKRQNAVVGSCKLLLKDEGVRKSKRGDLRRSLSSPIFSLGSGTALLGRSYAQNVYEPVADRRVINEDVSNISKADG